MFRPDIVDVWIYRDGTSGPEVLLMRRVPGRVMPGLWQGVSGSVEAGERIVDGALRELREETGFERPVVEQFFDLDLVIPFHTADADAIVTTAVFAARVRRGAEPVLSHEHDLFRWVPLQEAIAEVIWPGYREAIKRIEENLLDPVRALWFEIAPDGRNAVR
jgi:8-oxo-dGTP pyrophosphatase MutT (NUDIX family)